MRKITVPEKINQLVKVQSARNALSDLFNWFRENEFKKTKIKAIKLYDI
jgi:hypothetical protein